MKNKFEVLGLERKSGEEKEGELFAVLHVMKFKYNDETAEMTFRTAMSMVHDPVVQKNSLMGAASVHTTIIGCTHSVIGYRVQHSQDIDSFKKDVSEYCRQHSISMLDLANLYEATHYYVKTTTDTVQEELVEFLKKKGATIHEVKL